MQFTAASSYVAHACTLVQDPLMLHSSILVFANKQDMKGCLTPSEVCEALGLPQLKNRKWQVQSCSGDERGGAVRGVGLASSKRCERVEVKTVQHGGGGVLTRVAFRNTVLFY